MRTLPLYDIREYDISLNIELKGLCRKVFLDLFICRIFKFVFNVLRVSKQTRRISMLKELRVSQKKFISIYVVLSLHVLGMEITIFYHVHRRLIEVWLPIFDS